MKWLADENIPAATVHVLRNAGWDVLHVRGELAGISDVEVLLLAEREQRALPTFDRDFGELVFRRAMPAPEAVVYLRIAPSTPVEPAELLLAMLEAAPDLQGDFVVLDRESLRRRPLVSRVRDDGPESTT